MKVRFFAAAAEAAGTDETELDATGLTLAEVQQRLGEGNSRLSEVLAVSSMLVDGRRVSDATVRLGDEEQMDVLPPFAGG